MRKGLQPRWLYSLLLAAVLSYLWAFLIGFNMPKRPLQHSEQIRTRTYTCSCNEFCHGQEHVISRSSYYAHQRWITDHPTLSSNYVQIATVSVPLSQQSLVAPSRSTTLQLIGSTTGQPGLEQIEDLGVASSAQVTINH